MIRGAALLGAALLAPVMLGAAPAPPPEARCAAYWLGFADVAGGEAELRIGSAFRDLALAAAPQSAEDVTSFIGEQRQLMAMSMRTQLEAGTAEGRETLRRQSRRCDTLGRRYLVTREALNAPR